MEITGNHDRLGVSAVPAHERAPASKLASGPRADGLARLSLNEYP